MIIAVALAVCTASSFLVNYAVRADHLSHVMGFVLILGVAIIKAVLVGMIFMHLKWDWPMLYFIIIPVFILAVRWAIVLSPDSIVGPMADNEQIKYATTYFDKQLEKSP
jgi:cytochrome c oxidase subunit IV